MDTSSQPGWKCGEGQRCSDRHPRNCVELAEDGQRDNKSCAAVGIDRQLQWHKQPYQHTRNENREHDVPLRLVLLRGDTGASEDIFAISSGDIFSPYVATSTHVLCADLEWYTNGHTYYCEGATVTPNTWYHLVITYDKVNIRGYVNGVAGTVTPNSLGFNGVSYSPYIGGIGQQVYWKGNLANIQLYNAVLTAGQISSLYAEGINGAPILPGNDVGWWPLNGNAVDLSGKGLTGTPTNVVFSSSSANSVTVTHGQNEFFQTTWTGGTPPYSANYVISNTVTKTVLASQLYSTSLG